MSCIVKLGDRSYNVRVESRGDALNVRLGGKEYRIAIAPGRPGMARAVVNGKRVEFGWARRENGFLITVDGVSFPLEVIDDRARLASRAAAGSRRRTGQTVIRAPLPGLVREIHVRAGARVRRGDPMLTLDAMKMENEIQSPADGVVGRIHVAAGAAVEKDVILITLA